MDRELHDLLHRFWELEEEVSFAAALSLSADEQECEQHFLMKLFVFRMKTFEMQLKRFVSHSVNFN